MMLPAINMHIQLVDFPSATIDLQENKPIIIIISQLSYYTSKSATVQGGKDLYPQIHHSEVLSSLYIYNRYRAMDNFMDNFMDISLLLNPNQQPLHHIKPPKNLWIYQIHCSL